MSINMDNIPPVAVAPGADGPILGPQPPPEVAAAVPGVQAQKKQIETREPSNNWLVGEFGVKGKDATREIRGNELQAIKDMYDPLLYQIAVQLKEFSKSKFRTAPLSKEQQNFLELWDKQQSGGSKIMDTEQGAMLASSLVKQEVLLMYIKTGKDVKLSHKGMKLDKLDTRRNIKYLTSPFNLKAREISDYIHQFVGRLTLGGVSISADGNLDITSLAGIDDSKLPEVYKQYMDYSMADADLKGTVEFMLDAAEAELELKYSLGVHPKNWESFMPWDKLDLRNKSTMKYQTGDFKFPVVSSDIRFMMDIFRHEGGLSKKIMKPDEKLEIFFKALSGTTLEFSNRLLDGIDKTPETSTAVGKTITKLKERNEMATNPEKKKRAIERLTTEKAQFDDRLKKATDINTTNQTELDKSELDLKALMKKKPQLEQVVSVLAPEVKEMKDKIEILESKISDREIESNAERKRLSGAGGNANAIQLNLNEEEKIFNKDIAKLTKAIKEIKDGPNGNDGFLAKEKELKDKRHELAQEKILNEQIANLKSEQALYDVNIANFTKEVQRLEDEIEEGAKTSADKELIGRREAAIQALGREGEIQTELNHKAEEYNVDYFADTKVDPVLTAGLNHEVTVGYSKFIKLFFDPEHPPAEMSEAELWKHAMKILPEDVLAETLSAALDINVGYLHFTLKDVLAEMILKKSDISIIDMRNTMDMVMQTIERTSRLI